MYKFSRHTIYSGILLFTFGYTSFKYLLYRTLIRRLLLVLFYFKTNYEEHLLDIKFPDYATYKQKIGRFFSKK